MITINRPEDEFVDGVAHTIIEGKFVIENHEFLHELYNLGLMGIGRCSPDLIIKEIVECR